VRALRKPAQTVARRNIQVAPSSANPEIMRAEYLAQLEARIANQKTKQHYDQAEEVLESSKWLKLSFAVAIPLCVLSSAKDLLFGEHPHEKEGPMPDYMKIRNKEFPWECNDCPLFDPTCWKECREKK
jgi:hypothetical protein